MQPSVLRSALVLGLAATAALADAAPLVPREPFAKAHLAMMARAQSRRGEARLVEVKIIGYSQVGGAVVTVDGPTESPHRYGDGSLCLWHPHDPSEMRWRPQDGIVRLIDLVVVHLFREAWWRDTGAWPGPEAPHGMRKPPDQA